MRTKLGGLVVGVGLVLAPACAESGGGSKDDAGAGDSGTDEGDAGAGGELSAVTYNLGLLNSVGYVEERAPLAIAAVSDLAAEVLCVQEVWEQQHWDQLVEANADARPHTFRLDPDPGVMGKCDPDSFNPLQVCAEANCDGDPSLVSCVIASCTDQVAVLSAGCTECLLNNAPSGDFGVIRSACVGAGGSGGPLPPEERSYVSGGSYGTGLLSVYDLAETDEKKLDASTVRRAILYARIDDTELGSVHVFCTHLQAILENLAYEGSYDGWEAENAAHVQALIDFVDDKTSEGDQVLVLGDLNTGPEGDGITPSVPDNYALLLAAGFDDPFLSGPNAACTFCADNPLVLADDTGSGADIDHILTRGIDAPASVERVLTEHVTIEVSVDAGTEEREVGLSDHYGLRAVIGN